MKELFFLIFVLIVQAVSTITMGQTMKTMKREKSATDNNEIIRMITTNQFELVPAGVVLYELRGNELWGLSNLVSESARRGYYNTTALRIYFHNSHGLSGYYQCDEKRFYHAVGTEQEILKTAPAAVVLDNTLYRNTAEEVIQYDVTEVPTEVVGFFLFVL